MKARLAVEAGLPLPRPPAPSLFVQRCARAASSRRAPPAPPTPTKSILGKRGATHTHARTQFLESSGLARVELVLLIQEEKLEIFLDCVKVIRGLSF